MQKNEIIIHTDGAAKGNPGSGGWGTVIIINNEKVVELGAGVSRATNNQMELQAMIEGLEYAAKKIKPEGAQINIFSDSNYLLNGITSWIDGWRKNGWQTKAKQDVLNREYWEKLDEVKNILSVKNELVFNKVKGHAGDPLNERCDEIASGFGLKEKVKLFSGSLKDHEQLSSFTNKDIQNPILDKKTPPKKVGGMAYSYVSLVGGKVFADKTWDDCESRVKGKSGAKFKKVFSKQEEQDLVALWSLQSLF